MNALNYISVSLSSPAIKLANVNYNKKLIIDEIKKHGAKTNLFVFPELCLTGATIGDYVWMDDILKQVNDAVSEILAESYNHHSSIILGTPYVVNGSLKSCALFISDGKLLGIIPKVPIQHCASAKGYFPIFHSTYKLGIIIGLPSISNINMLSDADIVVCIDALPYCFDRNLAQNINFLSNWSQQAILYVNASANESSADNIYCGDIIVSECGKLIYSEPTEPTHHLALSQRVAVAPREQAGTSFDTKNVRTEIDLDIISGTRKKHYYSTVDNTYVRFEFISKELSNINRYGENKQSIYVDPFKTNLIKNNVNIALEILEKQALALARRINSVNIKSLVIGVSGGVDSTLALLVAIKSFEILKLDSRHIHAISMPGLATTTLTNDITAQLCQSLNVNHFVIDINDAVMQHFKDINHNPSEINIVYENTQARIRTMTLLNLANKTNSIVVGTGDMSEIALGWNTFNGDHISNYNVNCGIPKTVAIAMLCSFANANIYSDIATQQIKSILDRPITPELIPTDNGAMQETEKIIGPYVLIDFFLYYFLKYFLSKEKITYLAKLVYGDIYSHTEIASTLDMFFSRFYKNQYKRNCAPDGPQVFEISLSARNSAVFPSDI